MEHRRIVLGMDGSTASHRALAWVAETSRDADVEVIVVAARSVDDQIALDLPPAGFSTWRRQLDHALKVEWTAPLRVAGISYWTRVVEAAAAQALIDVATSTHADSIVIGTHGHGNLGDRLLGSVSYSLVHRAPCPVTIVPPDWHPTPPAPAAGAPAEHRGTPA